MIGWTFGCVHLFLLGLTPHANCGARPEENPWLGTLILAIPAAASVAMVRLALPWRRSGRWFSLPLVVLVPPAGWAALSALLETTVGGGPLCDVDASAAMWERSWAPVQLALMLWLVFLASRFYRPAR